MDSLDNQKLFKSEFIIGTNILDNTKVECIETVIDWTYFKSNIVIKGDYKSENKRNYGYLEIANLNLIKVILNDLVSLFKNRYPLSEIKDFKKIYFHDTLNNMENFIDKCKYYYIENIPQLTIQINISSNDFNFDNKIIDLILESSQDINYYEEHYMEIVNLLNNLTYVTTDSESSIIPPNHIEPKNNNPNKPDTIKNNEQTIAEKYLFFLNGKNLKNDKYLNEIDYKRLIEYTNVFFDDLKLPSKVDPIQSHYFRDGELRYSFFLMYKEKYPNLDYKEVLFDFLSEVFPQLKDKENKHYRNTANYKKFNNKPQYWDQLMKHNK